jgi:hypothetical protein
VAIRVHVRGRLPLRALVVAEAMKRATPARGFSLPVNVNTIIGGIGTILMAVIVWLVTHGLTTVTDTSKSVTTIEASLPYMKSSIDEVKASVASVQSDVKEKMVTRAESDEKQKRTESAINDVSNDVAEIKTEQTRVNIELNRRTASPPP